MDAQSNVTCAFVKGMSRVAPLRHITIPRLELTAAVTATKLAALIERELDWQLDSKTFWTDSSSTLSMIRNESSRFKTFVANRLSIIHSVTTPSQWRHVDTKRNPADIASRGVSPNKTPDSVNLWLNGPDFLYSDESHWPVLPNLAVASSASPEWTAELKVNSINAQPDESNVISDLINRYSCFIKLKRALAWIIRFVSYVRWKCSLGSEPANGFLTVNELDNAELKLLQITQLQSFESEIRFFKSRSEPGPLGLGQRSNRKSPNLNILLRLNTFFRDGILRVGGRLRNADLPYI